MSDPPIPAHHSIGTVTGAQFIFCMCTASYAFTALVAWQRWVSRGKNLDDYCKAICFYVLLRWMFYSLYMLGWHRDLNPLFYFLLSEGLPNYFFFKTTLQALLLRLREVLGRLQDDGDDDEGDDMWKLFLKVVLMQSPPDSERYLWPPVLLLVSRLAVVLRVLNLLFGFRGAPLGLGLASTPYRVITALLGAALFGGFLVFHLFPHVRDYEGGTRTVALRKNPAVFFWANCGAVAFHMVNAYQAIMSGYGGGGGGGSGGGAGGSGAGGGSGSDGGRDGGSGGGGGSSAGGDGTANMAQFVGGGAKPVLLLVLLRFGDAALFWLWTESIPDKRVDDDEDDHED